MSQLSDAERATQGKLNVLIHMFDEMIRERGGKNGAPVPAQSFKKNAQAKPSGGSAGRTTAEPSRADGSGRVTGIARRHPPTPPDARFSASGG